VSAQFEGIDSSYAFHDDTWLKMLGAFVLHAFETEQSDANLFYTVVIGSPLVAAM
jgi:hypothetical protein